MNHNHIAKKIMNTLKNKVTNHIKPQNSLHFLRKAEQSIPQRKQIQYKIDLKYADNIINQQRVNKLTLLTENKYNPSPLMAHSFMQSLYNIRYSRTLKVNYERELVQLDDGGQISLDWALPIDPITDEEYEPTPSTKIIFVVHGLTGGSNMNYIKSMIQNAQKHGYRCVAFNSRGINTELTTPKPFNGECLEDLNKALNLVRSRYPDAPIFGVGASYGSNMLLRWAGNMKENNFLTAIAGLATPYSIIQCVDKMGYVYEGFFVNRYKANCIDPHKKILEQLKESHDICLKRLAKTKKLKDFHEEITVKLFGYNSVDEYFNQSNVSSEQILNISRPCLLMHSRDDPIVTIDCVPQDVLLQNPQIIQAETSHGAHVCWYTGKTPQRWYPKPVIQFFEGILEEEELKKKQIDQNKSESK